MTESLVRLAIVLCCLGPIIWFVIIWQDHKKHKKRIDKLLTRLEELIKEKEDSKNVSHGFSKETDKMINDTLRLGQELKDKIKELNNKENKDD